MLSFIFGLIKFVVMFALIFFVVTFTVYFFNLDMKLTAALQPVIQHVQEKVKRDRHL